MALVPGVTTMLPLAGTVPMPWSMLTVVPLPLTDHASVVDQPVLIDGGVAVNEPMAGGNSPFSRKS